MRKSLFLGLMLSHIAIFAQVLNVENVFDSSAFNNTKHGINAAYMFHHILDENDLLTEDVKELMFNTEFDVIRFPGGAIGNYYRQGGQGYGAVKSEVQNVENTVQCNGSGSYCFQADQDATRNFVYDFLDVLEDKHEDTGRETDVMYMLNLLLHFVYNYNQILELNDINDLAELDTALTNGLISQDFYDRIIENYTAMQLIIESPHANINAIEMGNEFYFYQEVTTFPYKPTNSNPFFELNSALNTIEPRIERYRALINFYRRLIVPLQPDIKVGVPIGGINRFGNMANADELWNTAMKQWVLDEVDAIMPHMYIKTTGDEVDPPTVAADDDNTDLQDIKESFQFDIETKFINTIGEIIEFFELDSDFREIWITEYNVNKNNNANQFWDEWTNTFLHGAFLNELMKKMSASPYSDYIRYTILHAWSGGNTSYEHCVFTRKNTGDLIKRVSHFANDAAGFLKSANTRSLDGSMSQTQDEWELYADLFYNFEFETGDCPTERLIVSFTNMRTNAVDANFNFTDDIVVMDGVDYNVISSTMKGFKANTLASSCGRTDFDDDESNYDVVVMNDVVDVAAGVELPGISAGVIEMIIEPVNPDCAPLGIFNQQSLDIKIDTYPNPATDLIHVSYPSDIVEHDGSLLICSATGQELDRFSLSSGSTDIDVSGLDAGVYFIRIQSGDASSRAVSFIKL